MLIKEKNLKHWIDNFYGYGSWQSRLWFISHEEGGGDVPEEVADRIDYFFNIHPPGSSNADSLCDVRELYRNVAIRWDGPKSNLYSNRYEYRFDQNAVQHGLWKNLIAFAHGYSGQSIPNLLEYQKTSFLSSSEKNEALIQLYPLPSPHNHAWYYSWLDIPNLNFIKTRELYEAHVYQDRINKIISNIKKYKPEVVLLYGMNNITRLKESFQTSFNAITFKSFKAIKLQTPQHHLAQINGTKLIITTQIPALRHNRIETGFDWNDFGKNIAR